MAQDTDFTVEIPLSDDSKCASRNGDFLASKLTATKEGSRVRIGFVSRKLNRDMHAGAVISVGDMDHLARQWLANRGRTITLGQSVHKILDKIEEQVRRARVIVDG